MENMHTPGQRLHSTEGAVAHHHPVGHPQHLPSASSHPAGAHHRPPTSDTQSRLPLPGIKYWKERKKQKERERKKNRPLIVVYKFIYLEKEKWRPREETVRDKLRNIWNSWSSGL